MVEVRQNERGRGTYGPEKFQEELVDVEKMEAGINLTKRLGRELTLRCEQVNKYKATPNSNHNLLFVPNLLDQSFEVSGPD